MPSLLRIRDRLFYGWVIVAVFFITGTAILGTRLSFGVFFKSLQNEFGLTRAATSGVISVYLLFCAVFTIFGGWAFDRYGPRIVTFLIGLFTGLSLLLTSQANSLWQLYITYSLLLSIGTSAIFVVRVSTVPRWFDKKRGFALGIAGTGGGLGTLVMAPFATYLISNFNWRIAYIVIGVMVWLVVMPLSWLLRKDPSEIGALPDGAKPGSGEVSAGKSKSKKGGDEATGLSLAQALRTRSFWLMAFGWLLYAFCSFLIIAHIVPHATDLGISAMEAASILGLKGAAGMAGQVLMGRVSDSIGRKTTTIICSLLQVGAMASLIWLRGLWMLYLFAFVYGFASAGMVPGISALISDTFGLRNIGIIFGALEIAYSIGAAIGPAIGGFIFDVRGSYSLAFLMGAAAMLVVTLVIPLVRRETDVADDKAVVPLK